jgi:topoisomerase-4 subunit A
LRDALEERYLAYALSTIMHRALPDVRDGLKPVHRRLLFAMRQLRLDPDAGFKKCARVVGDVIGKYHPHGDQAVYDALVRLAQNFAVRYPLVDGQGKFGTVDGDNAAAMRYTEARLTEAAGALLDGIDEDTVDFRETYDGTESEPVVLPAGLPNLLANGAAGIAVGMATNIPPHNLDELCAAALHLIAHPAATTADLLAYVPGPDFPTGGILVEDRASILDAYETGRGGFRVRARWHREDTGRGTWQIVVTEIPYQVQKSRLIERIADLLNAKKLPLLGDVLDESAEDIRIVLEPRARSVEPDVLMEQVFRLTDLETRIPLNMNVLSFGRVPNVLSLGEVLRQWLDHRRQVLGRRSRFRLGKIEHRLEVLGGYLIAYLNIDEVIRIIREEDEPKAELMHRFALSDVQAEAILNMRLRALRKLEEFEIRKEHENLTVEKGELEALLASDERQWARIAGEIGEVRARFGMDTELGRRRTDFGLVPQIEVDLDEALIEREPITVILSEKGWIRALKGHGNDLDKLQLKTGDSLFRALPAQTTDKLILFATNGKFYTLGAADLPGGRGAGEPVRLMIDLEEEAEIIDLFVHDPARKLLIASSAGNGFIVAESEIVAATRKGKQALNLLPAERAVACTPAVGDSVAVVGDNRKLLVFGLDEVNEMARGRGVRLQKYRGGSLSDARVFTRADGLHWADPAGRIRTLYELAEWTGARAGAGRPVPRGFPKSGRFATSPFEKP